MLLLRARRRFGSSLARPGHGAPRVEAQPLPMARTAPVWSGSGLPRKPEGRGLPRWRQIRGWSHKCLKRNTVRRLRFWLGEGREWCLKCRVPPRTARPLPSRLAFSLLTTKKCSVLPYMPAAFCPFFPWTGSPPLSPGLPAGLLLCALRCPSGLSFL